MAKQGQTFFLEEWLRINTGGTPTQTATSNATSSGGIIDAWSQLRHSLNTQSFLPSHLEALQTLQHHSQTSLYVAEPQAKLVLSILSSQSKTSSLPIASYPLFFRLLYIWLRKSSKPSTAILVSAADVLSQLFISLKPHNTSSSLHFSQSVLLLGALSFVPSIPETSRILCLDILCGLLEQEGGYPTLSTSFEEKLLPDVFAGLGYALCSSSPSSSSSDAHFIRLFHFTMGIWGKHFVSVSVPNGLLLLHLVEWVISGLINSRAMHKIDVFISQFLETTRKSNYLPFAWVMTAAGVLRACNRSKTDLIQERHYRLRISAEERIEGVARSLISNTQEFPLSPNDLTNRILLQCISLALARCGPIASNAPVFMCISSVLLTEIFPLRRFYTSIQSFFQDGHPIGSDMNAVKEHLENTIFKEAGIISRVFCNQYVSVNEETKVLVESAMWDYCQDIYLRHREVALVLRGREEELLADLEKIAESAFLMIVVFALAVTKHRLSSKFNKEIQMETSVRILVSFSCVEYFRRVRLPEYMDTIRAVVVSVQENESACVSFVQSMPSYHDLTNQQGFSSLRKMEYIWSKDEVQTSRMLFYLRVIPSSIHRLPHTVFEKLVAPKMFLYMGHPNGKVAGASHSMFVAYLSSEKDSVGEDRVSSKERLVFYYIQKSLEGYPGITPFEGMASGVAAVVRHLPAGSPAIFYSIHSLVEKANGLCSEASREDADFWKNWQGESEPCKTVLDLLLHLMPLVDIQVLPSLMKLLAQQILLLPKDGQTIILNELYSQVAESDDVTRKPTLVSWLQSLSYLCSNSTTGNATSIDKAPSQGISSSQWGTDQLSARL